MANYWVIFSIFGKDDLLGEEIDVMRKDWMDQIDADLVYVPLGQVGSIPSRFNYRILFVNESIEDVSIYLNELDNLRSKTFNLELIKALREQLGVVQIWMGQQPNLDLLYLDRAEDAESELVQTFIS